MPTAFELSVWDEIDKIPYGQTRSYKDIAINLGKPNASRAVANACGKNPTPIIKAMSQGHMFKWSTWWI